MPASGKTESFCASLPGASAKGPPSVGSGPWSTFLVVTTLGCLRVCSSELENPLGPLEVGPVFAFATVLCVVNMLIVGKMKDVSGGGKHLRGGICYAASE